MAAQGLEHGDRVDIHTALPDSELTLEDITVVAYGIAPGTVGAYYPEANVLVPLNYLDEESGTPSYKSVPCSPDAALERDPSAGRRALKV